MDIVKVKTLATMCGDALGLLLAELETDPEGCTHPEECCTALEKADGAYAWRCENCGETFTEETCPHPLHARENASGMGGEKAFGCSLCKTVVTEEASDG